MKIFLLPLTILSIGTTGFCTTWTITAAMSPLVFVLDSITINSGDSVKFVLASTHNAVEVSQATWNANDKTPLPGFSVSLGGGLVLPAQLTVGTHYYVCSPHAGSGMKGRIFVTTTSGINHLTFPTNLFKVFPNPASEKLNVNYSIKQSEQVAIKLYDITEKISSILFWGTKTAGEYITAFDIDLSNFTKGTYFVELIIGDTRRTRKLFIE